MQRENYLITPECEVVKIPWGVIPEPYIKVINEPALTMYVPYGASLKAIISVLAGEMDDFDLEYIFEMLADCGEYGDKSAMLAELLS